jgi:hypothetical protein
MAGATLEDGGVAEVHMDAEQQGPGSGRGNGSGAATLVVGGVVVALLGAGWFILSHVVMHTPTPDAAAEALGVILGLLIVASVLGAVVSSRGRSG